MNRATSTGLAADTRRFLMAIMSIVSSPAIYTICTETTATITATCSERNRGHKQREPASRLSLLLPSPAQWSDTTAASLHSSLPPHSVGSTPNAKDQRLGQSLKVLDEARDVKRRNRSEYIREWINRERNARRRGTERAYPDRYARTAIPEWPS